MPDICMCNGKGCPKKEECYRYRAVPTPHFQSRFVTAPWKDGGCNYWEPVGIGDTVRAVEEEKVSGPTKGGEAM